MTMTMTMTMTNPPSPPHHLPLPLLPPTLSCTRTTFSAETLAASSPPSVICVAVICFAFICAFVICFAFICAAVVVCT
ncbi:hypothetical protein Hanom_Chr07g00641721 [Helianthus anomalus]